MNKLTVKNVDFLGDNLVAVKSNNGKIYTGVSYICKGIGLSKSQKDTQVQNIQNDLVLNKGCLKFQAGVIDPNNEVLTIELDYLPLWLAKISITPKMQEEQPEVTEKLVNYQLKAKDVLATAFIQQKPTCIEDVLISSLQEMKAMREQLDQVNHNALEAKAEAEKSREEIQGIRDIIEINPSAAWRKEVNRLLNAIGKKINNYNLPKNESYNALKDRAKCRPNVLVENLKKRAINNGMAPSKVAQLNMLDVLENDSRLREIYVAIVKDMAIKHGVRI